MTTRPEPPPEGVLLTEALKRAGLSVRKAAKQAGMSEGWWRQIVRGYQTLSGGGYGEVKGPDETVARMALVAGVTPEQLEEAGRDRAANELRGLLRTREHAPSPRPTGEIDPWSLSEEEFRRLPAEQQMAVLARMMRVAQESRDPHGDSRDAKRPAM
ncbi:helix-turn-helix domain-containing protein [Streptomyces blattellae]|uniref:helix-turn-helix domain-containing protein n=1 Tax=Streptomyces blattellae TaxID=2569855 RepID=UPI0012B92335|nr:helix-turn-helix transcriptional regulator [Streptomyces blattellae]